MKTVLNWFKTTAAKWLIGYLPDVVLWAIKLGTDKAKDSERASYVLNVVQMVATDAAMVARIMSDGAVSEAEAAEARARAEALVEEMQGLF
jgi:hypothetical protein